MKSKRGIGLITLIIIIAVILVIGGVIAFVIIKNNNTADRTQNNDSIFDKNNVSITSNDILSYNLENDTIWINKPLGITYNIPKQISGSMLNGSSSFTYLHGSCFSYYSGYKIYVDKSLEGHNDLKTLASDIIKEKNSDKYKSVYQFGSNFLTEFSNTKTENVKIGNIETVYFESQELNASSVVGNELKLKIIGYSFKYNDEYISAYGELLVENESKLEDLKQMLQYIINSIKKYNGESLQELGGNAKNYYDDGYTNRFEEGISTQITINHLSSHTRNGILRPSGYSSDVTCTALIPTNLTTGDAYLSWDKTLDGIIEATKNTKYEVFGWRRKESNIEILEKEKININNIDINKYLIKFEYNDKSGGKFYAIYTFIVDDIPYVFSYSLSKTIYPTYLSELSDEQISIYKAQTKTVADSFICTFRVYQSTDKYEYSDYINLFG